jgi:uncharacterized protein (DUF1778 family)
MTPINEQQTTHLTAREFERFLALLEDESVEPNPALLVAAQLYIEYNADRPTDTEEPSS